MHIVWFQISFKFNLKLWYFRANWLIVDKAIIFFISFDTTAIKPDTNVVIPPNTNINIKAIGLYSTIYEHLTNKYTPAITKQAACNNDETGVG